MKRQLLLVIWVAFAIFSQYSLSSCKKNDGPTPNDEQEALLMDSTYYFTLAYSLWNESLPQPNIADQNRLDLRSFTRDYSSAEEVLDALIGYMPINHRGEPLDRFSFIDRERRVGDEIGLGIHKDIGISPQFMYLDNSSSDVGLFVLLVRKNSPAAHVGIKRGFQILAVDGKRIRFTANHGGQLQGDIDEFNKMMAGNVRSLRVRDWTTEEEHTFNLPTMDSYRIDPFLVKDVFPVDNKRVGYLAYDSFVSVQSPAGLPNQYFEDMKNAFIGLGAIDELIVDLRYNGGGAGNAAELMTNIIAPSSADGRLMYEYVVNEILMSIPNNPFLPVKIDKTGLPDLGLTRVYFLVSKRSASASELVINCLAPHMDVQVISADEGTYGKPVGSFGQEVMNGFADLYITSFKTVNADGFGDYFDGLPANKKNVLDLLNYELGSPQENLFGEALFHIEYGTLEYGTYRAGTGTGLRANWSKDSGHTPIFGEVVDVPRAGRRPVQGLYRFDKVDIDR